MAIWTASEDQLDNGYYRLKTKVIPIIADKSFVYIHNANQNRYNTPQYQLTNACHLPSLPSITLLNNH